jgi:Uma2 family endonuclease
MGLAAQRIKTTYEAFLEVPDTKVAQIINGELRVMSRPRPRHGFASLSLGDELVGPFQKGRGGPGGWILLDEPEWHLADGDILVPDLAAWRRERLPVLPDTAYFETTPDWICEILSPSTARQDRADKMPIYAGENVSYLWLIDPALKTLEVYTLENTRWLLWQTFQQNEAVAAPPFDAISFDLGGLWGPEEKSVDTGDST